MKCLLDSHASVSNLSNSRCHHQHLQICLHPAFCSLHLLCHAADLAQKGQLTGSFAEQGALLFEIYRNLDGQVAGMQPPALGALLWGISSVPSATQAAWTGALLQRVAEQELSANRIAQYNTRELSSILSAAGKLCRAKTPEVVDFAGALVAELAARMAGAPVRGSFSQADFADLAAACAAIYSNDYPAARVGSSQGIRGRDDASMSCSPPNQVGHLMDSIAAELRKQLANKHSGRAVLTPRELTLLLGAYAALDHRTSHASSMLDAVAGFVSSRIKARHLNAVSRAEDLASVLTAYAALEHRSVAVPELLHSMGEQLRRNAAQMLERGVAAEAEGESSGWTSAGAPTLACPLPTLVAILESHACLGYQPSELTLQAVMPGVRRELASADPFDVLQLLRLMEAFQFRPGAVTLGLLVEHVAESMQGIDDGEMVWREATQVAERLGGLEG